LAPQGWHVPSDAEWTTLETALGGSSVAGGKMKEAGTVNWATASAAADNSSGFAGLPGGYRGTGNNGVFTEVGNVGVCWSATENGMTTALHRNLFSNSDGLARYTSNKHLGFSIRCLRD
jgi:uncharacterized protein (TIGR02145 family)